LNQATSEEQLQLSLSKQKLLEKSAAYDRLLAGKDNDTPDDGETRYLVDFERKSCANRDSFSSDNEETPSCSEKAKIDDVDDPEEFVEYIDSFGRTRKCLLKNLEKFTETVEKSTNRSNEMRQSRQPVQLDNQKAYISDSKLTPVVGPVHYQEVLKNENWEHGAGYYQFSSDEKERREQMKRLEELRQQTLQSHTATEAIKEKRRLLMQTRLAKIKERKNISVDIDDVLGTGTSEPQINLAEIPLPGEPIEEKPQTKLETNKNDQKRHAQVRPWDKRKKKMFTQNEWLERQREDRYNDFAPPSKYFP